jgi:hypothetical protein
MISHGYVSVEACDTSFSAVLRIELCWNGLVNRRGVQGFRVWTQRLSVIGRAHIGKHKLLEDSEAFDVLRRKVCESQVKMEESPESQKWRPFPVRC